MNLNPNKLIDDIAKVDAIMYAIETTYLEIDVVPEARKQHSRAVSAFYVLWDAIHQVEKDLNTMSDDVQPSEESEPTMDSETVE